MRGGLRTAAAGFGAMFIAFGVMGHAAAQVGGQRLGACPERVYLTRDQVTVAVAMATLGADVERLTPVPYGDPLLFDAMRECARTVRVNICQDKLLFGILDPVGAATGGAMGLAVDGLKNGPSVLGGLLGAGVAGMAKGVYDVATCNQKFEALRPAAREAFGDWTIRAQDVRATEVRDRVANAARGRRISAEDANALLSFVEQASTAIAD